MSMHSNHIYNLLSQLVEDHRSMYRIQDFYQKDAGDCEDCQTFWKKMMKEKEDHIAELTELVKKHL